MTTSNAAHRGRPRLRKPHTKRGQALLALIVARWGGVLGLKRATGLDRGTIERAIHSDDPSRLASASLDTLIGAGIPPALLGRAA